MKKLKVLLIAIFAISATLSSTSYAQSLIVNNYTDCSYTIQPIVNDACDAAVTNTAYFIPPTTLNHFCVSFSNTAVWQEIINGTPVGAIPSFWTWHAARIMNLTNSTGTMIGSGVSVPSCPAASYPALNAYPSTATLYCGGADFAVTITWFVNGSNDLIVTIM